VEPAEPGHVGLLGILQQRPVLLDEEQSPSVVTMRTQRAPESHETPVPHFMASSGPQGPAWFVEAPFATAIAGFQ